MKPDVTAFFDKATSTVSYLVADPATRRAAIVDAVLDYDEAAGRTATQSFEAMAEAVAAGGLTVDWILETHVHADHLSAAQAAKARFGAPVVIGAAVTAVQRHFGEVFDLGPGFATDGGQFDRLVADGERFMLGAIEIAVMHVPGHTPACSAYLIGDALFVGDGLFMPDYGTARCDFPGGSARMLYRSIRRMLALDPATRMFVGHDYAPGGRAHAWETTVGDQRQGNIHIRDGVSEDDFVAMREARDARLSLPRLILPSVQVNVRAGHLPPAAANGTAYLKIPLNRI
jgi:glyoxylase-like metal-dependent hydrolase (beta-lactamase superfamily II)